MIHRVAIRSTLKNNSDPYNCAAIMDGAYLMKYFYNSSKEFA